MGNTTRAATHFLQNANAKINEKKARCFADIFWHRTTDKQTYLGISFIISLFVVTVSKVYFIIGSLVKLKKQHYNEKFTSFTKN